MSMRVLLLIGAVVSSACASRRPELHEPVGQTTAGVATRAAPPPHDEDGATVAKTEGSPGDGEAYVAGKSAGPCGADPPIIEFSPSSMDISETQIEELRRLAECLTAAPFASASVVLVGYTDVQGTAAANLELGIARAQVVMARLIGQGVAPGRIVVASAGELQRPHARWGLRAHRVEILVARGGPPRPNEAPIARGIDAEGLFPRPRQTTKSPSSPPSNAPPVRGIPNAPSSRGR